MNAYLKRYMPKHHRADFSGMVAVYVLVAEAALGRKLEKGEEVHHKDFDSINDSPENLLPMTKQEHHDIPALQARFLFEIGMYGAFLLYWQQHKNDLVQERELKARLVKLENQNERERAKYNEREMPPLPEDI